MSRNIILEAYGAHSTHDVAFLRMHNRLTHVSDRYTKQLSAFADVSCNDTPLPPLEGSLSVLWHYMHKVFRVTPQTDSKPICANIFSYLHNRII